MPLKLRRIRRTPPCEGYALVSKRALRREKGGRVQRPSRLERDSSEAIPMCDREALRFVGRERRSARPAPPLDVSSSVGETRVPRGPTP